MLVSFVMSRWCAFDPRFLSQTRKKKQKKKKVCTWHIEICGERWSSVSGVYWRQGEQRKEKIGTKKKCLYKEKRGSARGGEASTSTFNCEPQVQRMSRSRDKGGQSFSVWRRKHRQIHTDKRIADTQRRLTDHQNKGRRERDSGRGKKRAGGSVSEGDWQQYEHSMWLRHHSTCSKGDGTNEIKGSDILTTKPNQFLEKRARKKIKKLKEKGKKGALTRRYTRRE